MIYTNMYTPNGRKEPCMLYANAEQQHWVVILISVTILSAIIYTLATIVVETGTALSVRDISGSNG
jgi:hypothetical protein